MALKTVEHAVDFCVVGGGLSGLCAAVAAARRGIRVALMQDRPMLGGNASSEIRMWVCGARGANNRETGLLEEIMMDNQYRNPDKNYFLWDGILYEKARFEPNIALMLNCSCMDAEMRGGRIRSVVGWQTTTQQFHRVEAKLFADCSGDSILAPLTGASFRQGREAKSEHGETIAPDRADARTMGLSCMLQAEETDRPQAFTPPFWAEKLRASQLEGRLPDLSNPQENFWYLELGGTRDAIADAESIRDELLRLSYGMWDYLKNDPSQREKNANWKLSWIGMLPGKRESRRYVGAYTMTERDVRAGGRFADEVAYGGWTMDDHNPAGFRTSQPPTIYHPAPSPYGIPFRSLYSLEIPNLLFAGRNISVTHAAMSSTRVMGTCAALGQAVGTAAALAVARDCLPEEISQSHIEELQDLLMQDDCFLPHLRRKIDPLSARACLSGGGENLESLRDGVDRPRPDGEHAWRGRAGDRIRYAFASPARVRRVRLVLDSDLNRETLPEIERNMNRPMFHNRLKSLEPSRMPATLLRAYRVEAIFPDGSRQTLVEETNNRYRLRVHEIDAPPCAAIELTPVATWGAETVRIFAFEAQA